MSGIALIWAANVKGLKPATKIVLIQLADFHNKQTGRCDPSAGRLADECEMGRSTLFRHLTEMEECKLITRHSKGDGHGGRGSNQYELHLDVVMGPSSKHKEKSRIGTGGVVPKSEGKSPAGGTGVVPNRDINLTIEPIKEPCAPLCDANTHLSDIVSELIKICPKGGRVDHTTSAVESLLAEGIDPASLIAAMTGYAADNEGNRRRYIRSTQSFLSDGFWKSYHVAPDTSEADAMKNAANKIRNHCVESNGPIEYSASLAAMLIQKNAITIDECRKAGISL